MVTTRGRPRSSQIDVAVRGAVQMALIEHGYVNTSIDMVAAAAGVAKTSIYRRWASKAELVFDALIHNRDITTPADTGSFAGDIEVLIDLVLASLGGPLSLRTVPALLVDLRADPALARRFELVFIQAEHDLVAAILDRAVLRGEFVRRPDPSDVHAQLLGTVFAWLFLTGGPPDDASSRLSLAIVAATAPFRLMPTPVRGG